MFKKLSAHRYITGLVVDPGEQKVPRPSDVINLLATFAVFGRRGLALCARTTHVGGTFCINGEGFRGREQTTPCQQHTSIGLQPLNYDASHRSALPAWPALPVFEDEPGL